MNPGITMKFLPMITLALLTSAPLQAASTTDGSEVQAPAIAPVRPPATPANAGQRWGADYFPNVELVSHEGERLRFFDDMLKDKVVLINFIYTSCPDACPLETARLTEVYNLLKDYVGTEIHFYSISVDPEVDTPEVLNEYTKRFRTGKGWKFLTGSKEDIKLVRQKLGMIRPDETELSDHTLSLMIGNQPIGRWLKRTPMDNPYMLANTLGSWIKKSVVPVTPMQDYADAPVRWREMGRGEQLYRSRCTACHLIGSDDGLPRVGPNLLGVVERREESWLKRWIREPDKMLAEGDALAQELYEAHGRVPMPNLRLDESEVDDIVKYMSEESARFFEERRKAAEAAAAKAEAAEEEKPSCCQKRDELVVEHEQPVLTKQPEEQEGSSRSTLTIASAIAGVGLVFLLGFLRIRR